MEADGKTMFCEKKDIVIGTQYVQKDANWKPRDYGALSMSEDDIRKRLESEGYVSVAADPSAPAKIKAAAAAQKLGVWTPHHLVTLDDSHIDARPEEAVAAVGLLAQHVRPTPEDRHPGVAKPRTLCRGEGPASKGAKQCRS